MYLTANTGRKLFITVEDCIKGHFCGGSTTLMERNWKMDFFKKKNEYIILKDGYNKTMIAGIVIVIAVLCFLLSTKIWMPDTRDNMTLSLKDEMIYKDTAVELGKEFLWNKNTQVAQISFKEYCIDETKDMIGCTVKNDKGDTMPITLIKGNAKPENEDDSSTVTEYILQFGMLRDTYYTVITIEKGGISYDFSIDYRDFKEKNIVEYSSSYLIDLDNYQSQIKAYEARKERLNKELESIQKMDQKAQQAKKARVDQIKTALKKIDNGIAVCNHQIEELNKGVES